MLEQLLDRTRRLADALLVLDEREAHVSVAALAEPDPGANGDVGVAREAQSELERSQVLELRRDGRPDEHRPAWRVGVPAGAGETAAERGAPAAGDLAPLR